MFWLVVPKSIREEQVKVIMTVLLLIFLFQFLPKVYLSIGLMRRMQKVIGYIFGTIFTINDVLTALLRQSKYSDLLSLHRFITQAGVVPNIITHNLIFRTYLNCRRPDTALEHYKQFTNDAPMNPSPTTYRILIEGLVENNKLDRALEIKEEMDTKGFAPDPLLYHYLMLGHVKSSDPDGVFKLYEDLKVK